MDTSSLLASLLFGAIGMGYLIYGKKQRKAICWAAGIGLCVFPYFVSNIWLMVAVGLALMTLPFLLRNWET